MALSDQEVETAERLKAKHGDLKLRRMKDGTFVAIRGADAMERTRFVTGVSNKEAERRGVAAPNSELAKSVIVCPETPALVNALLSKYPFLTETVCADAIDISEGGAIDLGNA